jgi:hypothetical protein
MRRTCLVFLLAAALAPAQGKKKAAPAGPKVLMALPPGVKPGATHKVTLRGLKLDGAKEVRLSKGTAKLLKSQKVAVPNGLDANKVGDSQVEVELSIPADAAGDAVTVQVVTPAGTSTEHKVLLDRTPIVTEKEPNDGFKTAQPIKVGDVVQGAISGGQDVDVFRFEGKAGQKVTVEVFAARLGSALDAFLTLYDAKGQVLASCDDLPDTTDARIEVTLPRAGTYHAAVIDAHDQGGVTHFYRLVVK